jgi:hypothetical protein
MYVYIYVHIYGQTHIRMYLFHAHTRVSITTTRARPQGPTTYLPFICICIHAYKRIYAVHAHARVSMTIRAMAHADLISLHTYIHTYPYIHRLHTYIGSCRHLISIRTYIRTYMHTYIHRLPAIVDGDRVCMRFDRNCRQLQFWRNGLPVGDALSVSKAQVCMYVCVYVCAVSMHADARERNNEVRVSKADRKPAGSCTS